MSEPKLSLIHLTYRPGGLGILLSSLAGQTFKDYELVVVDDYPGRPQRGKVAEACRGMGIPLGWHGSSKPPSVKRKCGLANAMNTGLIQAKASLVVFLHDYSSLSLPKDLERWVTRLAEDKSKLVSGVADIGVADRPPDFTDDLDSWNQDAQFRFDRFWKPEETEFENFYFGGPMEFFEAINGIDERADSCIYFPLKSMVWQTKALDYKLEVDESFLCWMVDHRIWEMNPVERDGQWRINCYSDVPQEPEWIVPSPNPFSLAKLRRGPSWEENWDLVEALEGY